MQTIACTVGLFVKFKKSTFYPLFCSKLNNNYNVFDKNNVI